MADRSPSDEAGANMRNEHENSGRQRQAMHSYRNGRGGPPLNQPRGNAAETVIWLLVILGLIVLVMQGMGYIKVFALQTKAAAIGLTIIGLALIAAAAYSYFQGIKLRAAIKRLTDQQRRKKQRVTLPSAEDRTETSEDFSEEDEVWTEQVRFSAVIEERERLARELHDAVSQQLFAISMTATAVSRTLEKDWERAKRQVQLIEEMAAVAQSEMRALLLHLRPVHLDGKNLGQALQILVEELKQKVPIAITLEVDDSIKLAAEAEDHLFRIAQEALSNTLRHSKADQMSIRLHGIGKNAQLIFQDNGVGFDLEEKKQTSYGLLTMEERINVLGGSMQLFTAPGQGVIIDIRIPVTALVL